MKLSWECSPLFSLNFLNLQIFCCLPFTLDYHFWIIWIILDRLVSIHMICFQNPEYNFLLLNQLMLSLYFSGDF